MIFKPSTLLLFTALASNASNSFAATVRMNDKDNTDMMVIVLNE
jgi:hypothetical protein